MTSRYGTEFRTLPKVPRAPRQGRSVDRAKRLFDFPILDG